MPVEDTTPTWGTSVFHKRYFHRSARLKANPAISGVIIDTDDTTKRVRLKLREGDEISDWLSVSDLELEASYDWDEVSKWFKV